MDVVNLISARPWAPEGSLEGVFTGHPGVLTLLPQLVRPCSPMERLPGFNATHTNVSRRNVRTLFIPTCGKAGILGRLASQRAR